MMEVITLKKIRKIYQMGDIEVEAIKGLDLKVEKGEFISIMGASGSGKSTLMNIIGCLDTPTSGEYILNGKSVGMLTKDAYADIRNQEIGFVFQGFNLLPRTTALENVELPLIYDRTHRIENPKDAAVEALKQVGLDNRAMHEPNQLSGGQQQRVAIARALVNKPAILLADEPTGNLDTKTSVEIMSLFQDLNENGMTIVLVTHEPDIASYTKRIVEMRDGEVLRDEPVLDVQKASNSLLA